MSEGTREDLLVPIECESLCLSSCFRKAKPCGPCGREGKAAQAGCLDKAAKPLAGYITRCDMLGEKVCGRGGSDPDYER